MLVLAGGATGSYNRRHMKRLFDIAKAITGGIVLAGLPLATSQATVTAPALAVPAQLAIAEIKITGDEYVVLQNNSGATITDLSQYWLESFNNVNPLTAGASNSSQQLPAVGLAPTQSVLLSVVARPTCAAAVAGKLNLSLTDGGGFLQIVQMSQAASGAVNHTPGDAVSWSSAAAGQIANVASSTKDPQGMYYRYEVAANSFGWQLADQDTANPCQLNVTITPAGSTLKQITSLLGLLSAADSAPATIISLSAADAATPLIGDASLPPIDQGLIIPEITELLPNPLGTGNDTTAEYIELYNPNDQSFDLSNFSLRAGTTKLYSYVFPTGSVLPGKAFRAYYAGITGLSLSNSGGRVSLLDPDNEELISSDMYGPAKDGQAWALANGNWYWTINLTPAAANLIVQPMLAMPKAAAATASSPGKSVPQASKAKVAAKVTAAKTVTPKAAKAKPKTALATNSAAVAPLSSRPIHSSVLALVAGLALLYGAYEYRTDISNQFFKFRRQLTARRANRFETARSRSDRARQ